MKFLYIFLRSLFQSRLTISECWQEAIDVVDYEKRTGACVVKPWEDPNDIDPSQLCEGPEPIIGSVIHPICHKK